MHIRYPLVYILNPKTLKHVVVWIPRSGFWSICRCLVIRSEDRATSEPEIHLCCVWTYTVFSVLCAQSSVLWHRISYLWLPISTQTLLVWDFQIRDDQPVLRAAVLSDELQVLDGLLGNFSVDSLAICSYGCVVPLPAKSVYCFLPFVGHCLEIPAQH